MKGVNSLIRRFLSVVEVPVFGAAVLAILILGEMNFFTKQVRYETEPIASIGTFRLEQLLALLIFLRSMGSLGGIWLGCSRISLPAPLLGPA